MFVFFWIIFYLLLKLLEAKMKTIKSVMADLMLRKGEFKSVLWFKCC